MSLRLTRARADRALMLGDDHRTQVGRRRAAATRLVGPVSQTAARIAAAPAGYLLAHGSSDVARQCELLCPLPAAGEVRLVLTPGRDADDWHLDVASRDRPGLLAAFTGVLARSGVEVRQAVLATWDDGAALEAFAIRCADLPDPVTLQAALRASIDMSVSSDPVADAVVTFTNDESAMFTTCDVTAADRPGLLHAVAVAIASAGADVHAARVTTVDGMARDRFDLSDRFGHRLDRTLQEAIRARVRIGVTPSRRRRSRLIGAG